MIKQNNYFVGILFAFFSAVFWAISATAGQYLFDYKDISPKWLVTVRLCCSGIVLFLFEFKSKKLEIFSIFKNKFDTLTLIFYGVVGLFLCQYTYFIAIELSNAAIATILQYTSPAFIILYLGIFAKKFPTKTEIMALFLVMGGVFILATHLKIGYLSISQKALFYSLISAICIVVYSIAPIKINKKYGILTCLSLSLLISGSVSFFVCKFWLYSGINDFEGLLAALCVVVFGTIFSFSFYMNSLNILGSTKTNLIASVEPVITAFIIYTFLGERYVFLDYIGFIMILSAALILAKR